MRTDVYQKITDQIVRELEKGVRPWMKPWSAEHAAGRITRPLRGNGIPYQGINVLMLWSAAMAKGYAAPVWMTFKQALELKAHVRKGEEGSLVVYADKIIRTETDAATGEEAERAIPFMKGYTVFNVEQIDGLPEHYYAEPAPRTETVQRIERAEAFFAATGAAIRHGGTMAFYSVTHDHVQMPPIEAFRDAESYYATLGHETTHWTRQVRLREFFAIAAARWDHHRRRGAESSPPSDRHQQTIDVGCQPPSIATHSAAQAAGAGRACRCPRARAALSERCHKSPLTELLKPDGCRATPQVDLVCLSLSTGSRCAQRAMP